MENSNILLSFTECRMEAETGMEAGGTAVGKPSHREEMFFWGGREGQRRNVNRVARRGRARAMVARKDLEKFGTNPQTGEGEGKTACEKRGEE